MRKCTSKSRRKREGHQCKNKGQIETGRNKLSTTVNNNEILSNSVLPKEHQCDCRIRRKYLTKTHAQTFTTNHTHTQQRNNVSGATDHHHHITLQHVFSEHWDQTEGKNSQKTAWWCGSFPRVVHTESGLQIAITPMQQLLDIGPTVVQCAALPQCSLFINVCCLPALASITTTSLPLSLSINFFPLSICCC